MFQCSWSLCGLSKNINHEPDCLKVAKSRFTQGCQNLLWIYEENGLRGLVRITPVLWPLSLYTSHVCCGPGLEEIPCPTILAGPSILWVTNKHQNVLLCPRWMNKCRAIWDGIEHFKWLIINPLLNKSHILYYKCYIFIWWCCNKNAVILSHGWSWSACQRLPSKQQLEAKYLI